MKKSRTFKGIILRYFFIFYISSLTIIFLIFNSIYYISLKNKFLEQNKYAASVAKGMLESEKEKIRMNAVDVSKDFSLKTAFQEGISVYLSKIVKDKDKIEIRSIDKFGFINLCNKLKIRINFSGYATQGEKSLAIYKLGSSKKELNLIAKTSNQNLEFVEKGNENYLKAIISDDIFQGTTDVSRDAYGLMVQHNGGLYLKGMATISVDQQEENNFPHIVGAVVVTKRIDQELLSQIKNMVNKDVILVDSRNNAALTTVFNNTDFVKKFSLSSRLKNKDDIFYQEIIVNNRKMGFDFFPIMGYGKEIIGYMGIGFYIGEFENIFIENTKMFVFIVLVLSFFLGLVLYRLVNKLFVPFSIIVEKIQNISNGNYKDKIILNEAKTIYELSLVADNINHLSEAVSFREDRLKELNELLEIKVEERTLGLKMAQDQLLVTEKVAFIGKFAGGIAHEINSPLAGMLTISELMAIDVKELGIKNIDEYKFSAYENLLLIKEGILKSKNIISKLLNYTDKNNGKFILLDLKEAVMNSYIFFEKELKKSSIEFRMELSQSVYILGNIMEITNSFNNVIENSMQALLNKSIENKIITVKLTKIDSRVVITIEDNGIGIDPSIKNKIFDPFFTTKQLGEGMGLGLTVSYNIIKKHRGKMDVKSKMGEWTIVEIEFMLDEY